MFPDSTCALTKSMAGRKGREMEVMMSSTVAARRKMMPGMQNTRDDMWDSGGEEDTSWNSFSATLYRGRVEPP